MMIHEKFMSGQFLLDLKNEGTGLLQAAAVSHRPQTLHHLQSPSPPMPALDVYSAYTYQQQLHQQFLSSHSPAANQSQRSATTEVLDLSRRDPLETGRKTPSPYHTNSSFGTGSPASSPKCSIAQQPQQPPLLPPNLLYAAKAQNINNLHIPSNFPAFYSGLYYASSLKPDKISTASPMPQPSIPAVANNNFLQSLASTNATSLTHEASELPSPQQPAQSTTVDTCTSSMTPIDPRNTRPFKAFPRDPLVIAANFAATDVLLDNPRVERYTEYRKRVLEQIRSSNGGSRTVTNPKMRRTNSVSGNIHEGSSSNTSENDERHHEESSDSESNSGHDNQIAPNSKSTENSSNIDNNNSNTPCPGSIVKDAAYYERRRKNNAAAKKSRDRRRIKEDEIAIRAAYLERQNIELLCQIDALKAQLATLTSKMA